MNKQELRKLTWKYFWKRKREEVWEFIKVITPISLFFIYLTSAVISLAHLILISTEEAVPLFMVYGGLYLFSIMTIVLVSFLLIDWLLDNWKLATEDAIKTMKRKKK